jgi:hypothetical protein
MAYSTLSNAYLSNLQQHGVKAVSQTSAFGQALCCLVEHIGQPVNIKDIREYVESHGVALPGGGDSLQVRHLGLQYGYNILKGGDVHPVTGQKIPKSHTLLLNLDQPYPAFLPKRRAVALTDASWQTVCGRYGNACVNCGSVHGAPMRWDTHKMTVLQQGHMDPRKPLTEDNCIPQCGLCNQQYKNKAVFNERGFVVRFNEKGFTESDAIE